MVGKTISHYKVLEKIGEGGMGEVYRAEDTNLSREVAIKVLPEQFTKDPQRLARFEREAKLLAQLNHPNIAAIYGFEHSDSMHFLVLELVPCETLQERVAKGPVPVEEALEVCRQIAEGVEAAHEKGVIHRDLKPANVKVTPEGKDVGSLIHRLPFGLLRTHIGRCSQDYSSPGHLLRQGRGLGDISNRRLCLKRLGQSKVQNLNLALRSDLHVGGLEVAVDDAVLVGVLQRLAGVEHGVVLNGGGDHVRVRTPGGPHHPAQGKVVGLGAAAGEDHFLLARAD